LDESAAALARIERRVLACGHRNLFFHYCKQIVILPPVGSRLISGDSGTEHTPNMARIDSVADDGEGDRTSPPRGEAT
jgi:hypothetical protein